MIVSDELPAPTQKGNRQREHVNSMGVHGGLLTRVGVVAAILQEPRLSSPEVHTQWMAFPRAETLNLYVQKIRKEAKCNNT